MKRDCTCPRAKHRHGTRRAYEIDKCGCLRCRAAHARAVTSYRNGGTWREADLVPLIGTRRRLQALACIGYRANVLAPLVGLTPGMVVQYRGGVQRPRGIDPAVAVRVAAAYDKLWDRPLTDANARRCSSQAKRLGWPPPMAWDDEDLDVPEAQPHLPRGGSWDLQPCGTLAAARRHHRRGEPLDTSCARAAARNTQDRKRRRREEAAA